MREQERRFTMTKHSQSGGNPLSLTVLFRRRSEGSRFRAGDPMSNVVPALAYIAEGKLYTQSPGLAAKLIESPFVQNILDRVERDRERGEWKSQGMAWNFASQ